jgi:hypothetical protein
MEREDWDTLMSFQARVVNHLGHFGSVVKWEQDSLKGLRSIWVAWDHLALADTRQITWDSPLRQRLELAWDAHRVYDQLRQEG